MTTHDMTVTKCIVHVQDSPQTTLEGSFEYPVKVMSANTIVEWLHHHATETSLILLDHRTELLSLGSLLGHIRSFFPSIPIILFTNKKLRCFQIFELNVDGYIYVGESMDYIDGYLRGFIRARGIGVS